MLTSEGILSTAQCQHCSLGTDYPCLYQDSTSFGTCEACEFHTCFCNSSLVNESSLSSYQLRPGYLSSWHAPLTQREEICSDPTQRRWNSQPQWRRMRLFQTRLVHLPNVYANTSRDLSASSEAGISRCVKKKGCGPTEQVIKRGRYLAQYQEAGKTGLVDNLNYVQHPTKSITYRDKQDLGRKLYRGKEFRIIIKNIYDDRRWSLGQLAPSMWTEPGG